MCHYRIHFIIALGFCSEERVYMTFNLTEKEKIPLQVYSEKDCFKYIKYSVPTIRYAATTMPTF